MNTASNFPLQSAPRVLHKDCISANMALAADANIDLFFALTAYILAVYLRLNA